MTFTVKCQFDVVFDKQKAEKTKSQNMASDLDDFVKNVENVRLNRT